MAFGLSLEGLSLLLQCNTFGRKEIFKLLTLKVRSRVQCKTYQQSGSEMRLVSRARWEYFISRLEMEATVIEVV